MINKKKVKKLNLFEYRRVSTETQKRNITIEIQEILNREYRERNDFNVEKVFIDDGKSGYKHDELNRPDYNRMWKELIERPDVDGIFSYDLTRLGRDSEELIRLRKLLKNNNKILVLTSYDINLDTFDGEFIYNFRAILSEYFGKIIKNRLQVARMIEYKAHPERFGRPKIEIPDKLKKKILHWYQVQQVGFSTISKLIQVENIKKYPDWFQRMYIGFGKTTEKEKESREKRFYLSPQTVGDRLKEWKVKIRDPKFRKKKVMDQEVLK